MAPRTMAYEKPKLMDHAMARADPNTDPIPFIPHIRGIEIPNPVLSNNFSPWGKGIPIKNPRGDSSIKDMISLK